MQTVGFDILRVSDRPNPAYDVRFSVSAPVITAFSKTYDDHANPSHGFVAVMTCSHADENCPLVEGASERIAITYDDPKDFDGTAQEATAYRDRVRQIGREMLFAFSRDQADP
jgi:arsenate reductase